MAHDISNSIAEQEDAKGLALYRRKRPFGIDGPKADTWDVMDLQTGEQLGQIYRAKREHNRPFAILIESQIGANLKGIDANYETTWLAADVIWRQALPVRSIIWFAMKFGIHAMDFVTRLFAIFAAFYTIWILIEAIVFTESSKLGQVTGAFADALVRWFNTWGNFIVI